MIPKSFPKRTKVLPLSPKPNRTTNFVSVTQETTQTTCSSLSISLSLSLSQSIKLYLYTCRNVLHQIFHCGSLGKHFHVCLQVTGLLMGLIAYFFYTQQTVLHWINSISGSI